MSARNPNFVDTLGFDADLINTSGILPNGATSATVDFVASSGDTYFPDVLTFSTDVFQPDFTSTNGFTKTVADLNGGSTLPGDILEYTLTMTNTGNDIATGVVLTDAIPANTTYVPGSLAVAHRREHRREDRCGRRRSGRIHRHVGRVPPRHRRQRDDRRQRSRRAARPACAFACRSTPARRRTR